MKRRPPATPTAATRPTRRKAAPAATKTRRGGRPSLAQSAALADDIVETATEFFLANGYGATSIEAVAQHLGIAKRTFYARFADKPALFAAVIHRIIEQLRPPMHVPLLEGEDVRDALERLAGLVLRAALSPRALALHRLLVSESARFPELAAMLAKQGATEGAIALIAKRLERETKEGKLKVTDAAFAARQFLHLVYAYPQHRAMVLGSTMSAREMDAWAKKAVALFLDGCRGR